MTGRLSLVCVVLLVFVSACTTVEKDLDQPDQCAKTSPGGDEDTDGGLGGTGNRPEDCTDARASE